MAQQGSQQNKRVAGFFLILVGVVAATLGWLMFMPPEAPTQTVTKQLQKGAS